MKQQQTKRRWIKMGLPLLLLCAGVLLFSYSIGGYSFAAESEPESDGNITMMGDSISVTGVANTVEYLTALYLYTTDPMTETSVVLKYDPARNALLINSSINANALGIGYNNFGEGVYGSVFVGGSGNKINQRGEAIYDDYGDWTGSKNSGKDNSVVIGGESNNPGSWGGSVVVGGRKNSIGFGESTMIGSVNSSLAGHRSVSLGAYNSSLNVQDWNSVNMGTNNHGDKFTFLIGSGITTHGGSHWSAAVGNVFVWSDTEEGLGLHGGNLGGHQGFYVNAKNGLGLNTSTPRITFDARSSGPLKLTATKGVKNGAMVYNKEGTQGILCDEEKAQGLFRGVLSYAQTSFAAGFCGCDGEIWKPMSYDPVVQAVCTEQDVKARKCNNGEKYQNAELHIETQGAPRWDESANDGNGEWVNLDWTFMGVPSLLSGDVRECSFTCKVGYHPNEKSPKGWFTGDCVACTGLEHGGFISPGTGINDCEFACFGGFKYNKWAENKKDRCSTCNNGEWSEHMNQAFECNKCVLPIGMAALTDATNAGQTYTDGVMGDGINGNGEAYFQKFTSPASGDKYHCDYDCAPGYMYHFNGTALGNICVECGIGTYSPGGKYPGEGGGSCAACENMNSEDISFSWTDIDGKFRGPYIIKAKDVSKYTTKGKDGPNSCEWECNASIGLVKSGKSCKCPSDSHLELVQGDPKCVSNYGGIKCAEQTFGENVILGPNYLQGQLGGNGTWKSWKWTKKSWTYVSGDSNLKGCEWTCPDGYTRSGNGCLPPDMGECFADNGKLLSEETDLSFSSSFCSSDYGGQDFKYLELNYYVPSTKFNFYPKNGNNYNTNEARYLITWTCRGKEAKYNAGCYAYIKGPKSDGVCDETKKSSSGKAEPACSTNFDDCDENKNCPPEYVEKTDISHGVKWRCPGVFGGGIVKNCKACDEDYDWWQWKQKCTEHERLHECNSDGFSSTSHLSHGGEELKDGKLYFKQVFNVLTDKYWPADDEYSYRLKESPIGLGICEFACDGGYHYYNTAGKCYLDPECGDIRGNRQDTGWKIESETGLCIEGTVINLKLVEHENADDEYTWGCSTPGMDIDNCSAPAAYKCRGDGFENASRVDSDDNLTSFEFNTLYGDYDWVNSYNYSCAWKCDYGYSFIPDGNGNFCIKCPEGTEINIPKRRCEDDANSVHYCEEGLQWSGDAILPDGTKGGCVKMGTCGTINTAGIDFENGPIKSINDMIPWSNKTMSVKCVNADKVTAHTCQFSCAEGYACHYSDSKCVAPYCGSAPKYAYVQKNPVPNRQYMTRDTLYADNDWRWYPNNEGLAVDEATFLAATESLSGCWWWCEDDRLYTGNGSKQCLKDAQAKIDQLAKDEAAAQEDPNNPGGNGNNGNDNPQEETPSCSSTKSPSNLYGNNGSAKNTPTEVNQSWTFYPDSVEYEQAVKDKLPCIFGCKAGTKAYVSGSVVDPGTLYAKDNICWRQCAENEYYSAPNSCKKCDEKNGYVVDEDSKMGPSAELYNYTKCKYRCTDDYYYSTDCGYKPGTEEKIEWCCKPIVQTEDIETSCKNLGWELECDDEGKNCICYQPF